MFGRRGVALCVLAARGQRNFEGAAGTRATGARLPAGARALRDAREAPYQQPSRTPLHKVLCGPPDGASGTSAGCKTAAVHVRTPCSCGRATTWALAAQIPRHVCTCENVLWFVGSMPPFSCCVANSLVFAAAMAENTRWCSAWGGRTQHRRAAQAAATSLGHLVSGHRGWLTVWTPFSVPHPMMDWFSRSCI